MNRTHRRTLRHAAALLLEDARLTRESCQVGELIWACPDCKRRGGKCNAQRSHDARIKAAAQLKTLAQPTSRAPTHRT